MSTFEELKNAMGNLEEDDVTRLLDGIVKSGSGMDNALAACQAGMDIVGTKYTTGEYFVADLIYAGEIMTNAVTVLKPLIKTDLLQDGRRRRMVIERRGSGRCLQEMACRLIYYS